jgi:hypothetical protein
VANYLIRSCNLRTEYVVDDALEPGLTANTYSIVFTGESSQSCFNVISGTTDPITEGINSLTGYSNCLECIQQNDFSIFAFDCINPDITGPLSSQYFNELPFGNFYKFCFSDSGLTECLCLEMLEILPFSTPLPPFPVTFTGPFTECGCNEFPISAGTEYTICNICETSTGVTVTTINPPHPTWTRPDGKPVVLLDAVQLGGMFGLNN